MSLYHSLVQAVQNGDVSMTMDKGPILVENGKWLHVDLNVLTAEIRKVMPSLLNRRDGWVAASGLSVTGLEQ